MKNFQPEKYGLPTISYRLVELDIKNSNDKLRSNSLIYNLLTNELHIGIKHWRGESFGSS